MNTQGNPSEAKITVAVRVRPLITRELNSGCEVNWAVEGNILQQIEPRTKGNIALPFAFDHVFSTNQKTVEVYDTVVAPIVEQSFSGYNGTVFCYGQTSSGKTYTLYGNEVETGILSLTAQHLFRRISCDQERTYIIRVGLIEIYNEKVSDLLNETAPQEIQIIEVQGNIVPKNLEEIQILKPEDMLEAMQRVQSKRRVGETRMNQESSRSHTILRIVMESVPKTGGESEENMRVTTAVLNFVDLAGSEKASQTGAVGDRLKEAGFINRSLSVLSQVVMQLAEDSTSNMASTYVTPASSFSSTPGHFKVPASQHVRKTSRFANFRNSKLTRLLQSSLSGNAYITMIFNVTPTSTDETISTLRFARTAKKLPTNPVANHVLPSDAEYQNKIKDLQNLVEGKTKEIDSLTRQLEFYKKICPDDGPFASGTSMYLERRRTFCPSSLSNTSNRQGLGAKLPTSSEGDISFSIDTQNRILGGISHSSPFVIDENAKSGTLNVRASKRSYNWDDEPLPTMRNSRKTDVPCKTEDTEGISETFRTKKFRSLTNSVQDTPPHHVRFARAQLRAALEVEECENKEYRMFVDAENKALKEQISILEAKLADSKEKKGVPFLDNGKMEEGGCETGLRVAEVEDQIIEPETVLNKTEGNTDSSRTEFEIGEKEKRIYELEEFVDEILASNIMKDLEDMKGLLDRPCHDSCIQTEIFSENQCVQTDSESKKNDLDSNYAIPEEDKYADLIGRIELLQTQTLESANVIAQMEKNRIEAGIKTQEMEAQLTVFHDILAEANAHKSEAEKAYAELKGQSKQVEDCVSVQESTIVKLKEQLSTTELKLFESENLRTTVEKNFEVELSNKREMEESLVELNVILAGTNVRIRDAEKTVALAEERRREVERSLVEKDALIVNLKDQIGSSKLKLIESVNTRVESEKASEAEIRKVEEMKTRLLEVEETLVTLEIERSGAEKELELSAEHRKELASRLIGYEAIIENLNEEIRSTKLMMSEFENVRTETESNFEREVRKREGAEVRLAEVEGKMAEIDSYRADAESRLRRAEEHTEELENRLAGKDALILDLNEQIKSSESKLCESNKMRDEEGKKFVMEKQRRQEVESLLADTQGLVIENGVRCSEAENRLGVTQEQKKELESKLLAMDARIVDLNEQISASKLLFLESEALKGEAENSLLPKGSEIIAKNVTDSQSQTECDKYISDMERANVDLRDHCKQLEDKLHLHDLEFTKLLEVERQSLSCQAKLVEVEQERNNLLIHISTIQNANDISSNTRNPAEVVHQFVQTHISRINREAQTDWDTGYDGIKSAYRDLKIRCVTYQKQMEILKTELLKTQETEKKLACEFKAKIIEMEDEKENLMEQVRLTQDRPNNQQTEPEKVSQYSQCNILIELFEKSVKGEEYECPEEYACILRLVSENESLKQSLLMKSLEDKRERMIQQTQSDRETGVLNPQGFKKPESLIRADEKRRVRNFPSTKFGVNPHDGHMVLRSMACKLLPVTDISSVPCSDLKSKNSVNLEAHVLSKSKQKIGNNVLVVESQHCNNNENKESREVEEISNIGTEIGDEIEKIMMSLPEVPWEKD